SDIHVGDLMSADRAIEIVEQLAAAEPDMVCNTGDLVDLYWPGVEPVAEAIAAIKAPLGNFFVLGNHDELDSGEDVDRIVSAAGTTVLHDDVALITRGEDRLRVGGIGWSRTPAQCRQRIDTTIGDERVDLLLSHNPKAFDHAAAKNIPLTLSGHTHGGQIARRNKPDANLAVAYRRSAGLYEHGDCRLYVTVGAGSLFPIRWNVPAEIAILTVRCGD
ncbi:MAG: metallophosphoesterase family protein, partial [Phycisphaerales bacterium]|nr:metallophosphoesterase family protein [Phycisphaerales bacterium]